MKFFSALCLVLAPIALTVATAVDPALGDDQGYGIYRAHPDATQWHSLLLHWAWVLFVPGLLGLLIPIRKRGAVLARISWLAVVLGLVTFSALMAFDFVLLALEQNLPDGQVAEVDTAFQGMDWAVAGWQFPGLIGWALALLVTPVAAARARVISWWTAGAALLGAALYLLFAIEPLPLNITGPVVLIGAYGVAAWQLLRHRSTDEPDTFGHFRHRLGQVCLYAAPIAFAGGMATVPDPTGDGADSLANPGLTQASAFLLHLGWVLFVPAVLALAERGRRFTRVTAWVAVIGLINFSALMLGDYADLAARQEVGAATADAMNETLGGYPLFAFGWVLPGMVLTFLGLLLVTLAAAYERVVSWWVPALTAAGLAGFFLLGLGPIGVVGPLLLLAGFGLAARGINRVAPVAEPAPIAV
jgi:hypothetical protein